ncbi:hypothetical protein K440DRAFT_283048 [Wilcoxina mikolae CBS 423.85]|nr:hypothetical protein K440DRAFT_283048 [Wilcoxina mikolae CBS 423.85]
MEQKKTKDNDTRQTGRRWSSSTAEPALTSTAIAIYFATASIVAVTKEPIRLAGWRNPTQTDQSAYVVARCNRRYIFFFWIGDMGRSVLPLSPGAYWSTSVAKTDHE